jgi:uncharacterized protein (DUF934 family)
MASLIRQGRVVEDGWQLLPLPANDEPVRKQAGKPVLFKLTGAESADAATLAAIVIPAGPVIVPLALWLARREELAPRLARRELGVWLDGHELAETLAGSIDDPNRFAVIAVNFPKFADGRGYTTAALLRARHGYRGELRAVGDVLRDQLFFMQRCGFDAFALRADRDPQDALASLGDFTTSYQGAVDDARPLYRRTSLRT